MADFAAAVEGQAREDFDLIWATYSQYKRIAAPTASRADLRFVHRFAFLMNLFGRALPTSWGEHQTVFLKEAASDALHVLHNLLSGDCRGACFYLRSVVENTWRHLYFKDHPVEYAWLSTRPGYYKSMEDLREYCKAAPVLVGVLAPTLADLGGSYSTLSRTVHTSIPTTALLRNALDEIKLSEADTRFAARFVRAMGRDVILLFAAVHRDVFHSLHPKVQRFLLTFLDPPRRQIRLKVT